MPPPGSRPASPVPLLVVTAVVAFLFGWASMGMFSGGGAPGGGGGGGAVAEAPPKPPAAQAPPKPPAADAAQLARLEASRRAVLAAYLETVASHAERAGNLTPLVWTAMGHIGEVPEEVTDWLRYADDPAIRTMCEVGFNAGHSAAVFLAASPNSTLHVFDLMAMEFADAQVKLFKRVYGDRLHVYKGSSFDLVPWFRPRGVVCDLFSIDGDHSYEGSMTDMWNALKLVRVGGRLVADDVSNDAPGVRRAWKFLIDGGYTRQLHCGEKQLKHVHKGWCAAEVLKQVKDSDPLPEGYKQPQQINPEIF